MGLKSYHNNSLLWLNRIYYCCLSFQLIPITFWEDKFFYAKKKNNNKKLHYGLVKRQISLDRGKKLHYIFPALCRRGFLK